jgi:hypothetical protein
MKKHFNIRLEQSLATTFKEKAKRQGTSATALITQWIEDYCNNTVTTSEDNDDDDDDLRSAIAALSHRISVLEEKVTTNEDNDDIVSISDESVSIGDDNEDNDDSVSIGDDNEDNDDSIGGTNSTNKELEYRVAAIEAALEGIDFSDLFTAAHTIEYGNGIAHQNRKSIADLEKVVDQMQSDSLEVTRELNGAIADLEKAVHHLQAELYSSSTEASESSPEASSEDAKASDEPEEAADEPSTEPSASSFVPSSSSEASSAADEPSEALEPSSSSSEAPLETPETSSNDTKASPAPLEAEDDDEPSYEPLDPSSLEGKNLDQLSFRLGCTPKTLSSNWSKYKDKPEKFIKWSKKKDPEFFGWYRNNNDGLFYLASCPLSQGRDRS